MGIVKPINFENYKQSIIKAIKEKLEIKNIKSEGGFDLIEGFFNRPIQTKIAGKIIIGGKTVPMVAIAEKKTGRMHFFALKALLPEIEI